MTIKRLPKAHGFTLVELMIALAISLFLIGGVVLIQSSSRAASMKAENLSRLQEDIRFASDLLLRDIRNAGFRDQLSLSFKRFRSIGEPFVKIATEDSGSKSLEIRYTGWGSCQNAFEPKGDADTPSEIRNRYFVDVEKGELKCDGEMRSDQTAPDGTITETIDDPPAITLVSRVNDVDFTLLCVSSTSPLTLDESITSFNLWSNGEDFEEERRNLRDACYGVRVNFEFKPADGSAGTPPVELELNASFRNILLGQMMWQSVCQIGAPPPEGCSG